MSYTALIVDIVNSKKLSKNAREHLQLFIKDSLGTLNNIFRPSLLFEVIFSAGDEVQGLFKTPSAAYLYLRLLKLILAPLQLRSGLGVGDWDIRIPDGTSTEQDGSAYHNARSAISDAHNKNDSNILLKADHANDIYINTLINVSSLLENNQSYYQSQILLLIELMIPIFDLEAMDVNSFTQTHSLLRSKTKYDFYTQSIKNQSESIMNLLNNIPLTFEPFCVFAQENAEYKLILPSTIKRGLSTKISAISQTSRQNIDNIIKTGNIAEIRNLNATALMLINQTFAR
jgi:hypothetical protein